MSAKYLKLKSRRRKNTRMLASINLVSLMDIFTILVFFLLVNSTEVELLPGKANIALPASVESKTPERNIVVTVSKEGVSLQGELILTGRQLKDAREEFLPELKQRLDGLLTGDNQTVGKLTIMGDKSVPFEELKKVLSTCTASRFAYVSLAVQQKAGSKDS